MTAAEAVEAIAAEKGRRIEVWVRGAWRRVLGAETTADGEVALQLRPAPQTRRPPRPLTGATILSVRIPDQSRRRG